MMIMMNVVRRAVIGPLSVTWLGHLPMMNYKRRTSHDSATDRIVVVEHHLNSSTGQSMSVCLCLPVSVCMYVGLLLVV